MKNTGDGRRVHRVEKEVQSVIGMHLISGFSQRLSVFVNVSKVIMAGDLRSAKIYLTVLPKWQQESEEFEIKSSSEELTSTAEVVSLLNEYAFEFQNKISSELKLRYVPKVKFYADLSTEKVIQVDSLLSQISNDNKNNTEDQ
ncbi:MAG: ribosome-binding factor A [Bdellovibrionales bacterium]|nr:ribosome-binding factor A [Bdellovibrionales bacterium]